MSWHLHAYHAAWALLFAMIVAHWGWLPLIIVYLGLGSYYFWQA